MLMSLGGYGADVHEAESGVGGGLDPDEFGVWGDVIANIDFNFRCESHFYAVRFGDLGEIAMGAAIDVANADDMASCGQGLEDDRRGCGTGGESKSILS